MAAQFGVTPQDTPLVIVHGRLLRNPSNAELAAAIGLPAPSEPQASCDLLVVGSGPAGLSAAVYGASEGMRVIVLDATAAGGQAGTSSRIENYLGFPSGISGAELAERALLQAQKFGARFAVPAEATSIEQDDGHYRVRLSDGTSLTSALVVLATGVRYRRLDVPRADYFEKMSIYYAASQAEALLCAGDPVAIVGGGNSAGQAAVFLSAHATQVTLIVREGDLGEHMSRYLIDQITRIPNVHVMTNTEVRELHGERPWRPSPSRTTGPARGAPSMPARCSSSSAWPRAPAGSAGWSTSTTADSSAPGQVRTEPIARCWRPASPASSRSATSAPARPNESPPPSARARWRSGSLSNEHAPPRR